jgi:hypothetical protein
MTSLHSRSVRIGIPVGMLIVFGNLQPQTASAASQCAPAATAQGDVVGVMQNTFAAMRDDDLQRFQEVAPPNLYAYDGGRRFNGPASLVPPDGRRSRGWNPRFWNMPPRDGASGSFIPHARRKQRSGHLLIRFASLPRRFANAPCQPSVVRPDTWESAFWANDVQDPAI